MHQQVIDALNAVRYRVVANERELAAVRRLRYKCYRAEGMIADHVDEIMADDFDEAPNCIHVAVEMNGEMLAAMRLHLVSQKYPSSPTLAIFPELNERVDEGLTLLDPTRFITDPSARKQRLPLHLLILRVPFLAAISYDIDLALATVRSEHAAFYLRYLGYERAIPARSYPELKKPLQLLVARFPEQRKTVLQQTPVFGPIESIPHATIDFPDLSNVFAPSKRRKSAAA